MRLRRRHPDTHPETQPDVIDLTDGAHAWWAAADDLVTSAPSFAKAEAPPPPQRTNQWAPEMVYTWGSPDPHEVLGVDRDASWADIERARRRLAKTLHPDLAGGRATPGEIDLRERRMRAVNEAYDAIKHLRAPPA
jgi:DnaJ-domain-containing protein 1